MLQPVEELRSLARRALLSAGVVPSEAEVVVEALLEAELRGRPTHGLLRLADVAHRFGGRGPTQVTVLADGGCWLHVDGGAGVGYVTAQRCVDWAAQRATTHGLGLVGVRRVTHCGMLGYYTEQLAREGLVGVMMADCRPVVAPFGATSAVFGTNPVSIAFPHDPFPVLIDMGTSAVTLGGVLVALREGRLLPGGSAYDASGRPTCDPAEAQHGALCTFGGHRGSALALAVQLLSAVLVGAEPLPRERSAYGLFLLAIDPVIFGAREQFQAGVSEVVEAVTSARPAEGVKEVFAPGQRAWRERARRLEEGIDVPEQVLDELTRLAESGQG